MRAVSSIARRAKDATSEKAPKNGPRMVRNTMIAHWRNTKGRKAKKLRSFGNQAREAGKLREVKKGSEKKKVDMKEKKKFLCMILKFRKQLT